MGATEFSIEVCADRPAEAFRTAQIIARYEHGHAGYTGTIAEKDKFRMINLPLSFTEMCPYSFADECMLDDSHFCQDKWGPAACIQTNANPNVYLFFGFAPS